MLFFRYFKEWNDKYDFWFLLSEFFFLFGVLLFNWNPVLLILWFMVDTASMLFFGVILFYKEKEDAISTVGFTISSLLMIAIMAALYSGVEGYIVELKMEKLVNSDPSQIFNPVVLPIVLSCCILGHHAEYKKELQRMDEGTYNSSYLKHFYLRYILVNMIILSMVFSFYYFQVGIVTALIAVKSLLRLFNKKYRTIL